MASDLANLIIAQQPIKFLSDDAAILAGASFQPRAFEHFDVAASVTNQSFLLEVSCRRRDVFPAHAQHARDKFLSHD